VTTTPDLAPPRRLDLRAPLPPAPGAAAPDRPELWLLPATVPHDVDERLVATVLSAEETARAAAFRFRRDRDCYVACHLGLRLLLGARLGCEPHAVPLIREDCPGCGKPHGRPAVAGGELHFSLSHTHNLGLLALAARPVGVDLEPVPDLQVAADVAARLHPTERAELAALPDDARPLAFARAWVRTEAYLKGLGIGLARPPSYDYLGTTPTPAHPPGWTLADIPLPPHPELPPHTAALALANP
jgi:4'-phosphopantetheinyl transferase